MHEENVFKSTQTFRLESGEKIEKLTIAYRTCGNLNTEKNNVIGGCHALTANSDIFDRWPGLFGSEELFNINDHFVATPPLSADPNTGNPYHYTFPFFTIRDIVAVNQQPANKLDIAVINVLIGGSFEGRQVLEWTATGTMDINNLIVIDAPRWSIPDATYYAIESRYGYDVFLVDPPTLSRVIGDFYAVMKTRKRFT